MSWTTSHLGQTTQKSCQTLPVGTVNTIPHIFAELALVRPFILGYVTLGYGGVGPNTVRVSLLGPERRTGGQRRSRGSWPLLSRRVSEESTLKYHFCTKIGALLGQSHLTCVRGFYGKGQWFCKCSNFLATYRPCVN